MNKTWQCGMKSEQYEVTHRLVVIHSTFEQSEHGKTNNK